MKSSSLSATITTPRVGSAILRGNIAPEEGVVKQSAVNEDMLVDGRFSGDIRGAAIGHISPDVAESNPIALNYFIIPSQIPYIGLLSNL